MAQYVRSDQPIAIELVSTVHVEDGEVVDALTSERDVADWCRAEATRLPVVVRGTDALAALRSLRDAVRRLFVAATSDGGRPDADDVALVNRWATVPPPHVSLVWPRRGGGPQATTVLGDEGLATLLGALARDAIDVLTGGELRACGAPSCVLFFVRSHPRQAWCSASCGNRARVARHYRRTHGGDDVRQL